MRRALLGLAGLLLLASPAFSNGLDDNQRSGTPNPAARFCGKLEGISRAVDLGSFGGPQIGLCRLHDDALIDEWTLFRAARGTTSQAVLAFLESSWEPGSGIIDGWAEQACLTAGGQVVEFVEHMRPGSPVRLCEFPDHSLIEAWTLFAGPDLYPELADAVAPAAVEDNAFEHCPWPRTCMAPCQLDPPAQVVCRQTDGKRKITSFACCCCGTGQNSFHPIAAGATLRF